MSTTADTRPDLFLPEPPRREVHYTVISVDDHLVEPPGMFAGRLPSRLADRAPTVITEVGGQEIWEFEGARFTQVGMNAMAGRRPDTMRLEPSRFDEMRPGCYDIDARIRDMDINGVWASLNFPSMVTGFCGRVYSQAKDQELGLAVTRAWNDWLFDEWYSPYPDRIIPLGITWLADPVIGAEEIRRNADRGFRSVTLPERPHRIGFPSLFTGYWDPIIEACAETDYPHGDGTWPDTQEVIRQAWGDLPSDEIRMMCCENAARLFRHALPWRCTTTPGGARCGPTLGASRRTMTRVRHSAAAP